MLNLNSLKRRSETNLYDGFLSPDLQSSPWLNSDLTNDLKKLTGIETEKRQYARIQAQHKVSCTFYDSFKDDFIVLDAQVENRSDGGLLLTTNLSLEIGMPVLVRLEHYSEKDGNDELKDGIHARVVRCDKITEKESCYRIAIEYFELCQ